MRRQQTVRVREVRSVLLQANNPVNGIVYPEATLRKLAETDSRLSFEDGQLIYTGPALIPVDGPVVCSAFSHHFESEHEQEEQCQKNE